MKSVKNSIILFFLLLGSLCIISCGSKDSIDSEENPIDIPERTEPVQWMVTELAFTGSKIYTSNFDDVDLDVIFSHSTGKEIKVPAFWDKGDIWKVRFAPTLAGSWTYKTVCSDTQNTGLNNKTGNLSCAKYNGELAIYKHGFVNIAPFNRYFTYNDGTPFFYLGDTHWNFPANSLPNFKTIIDKRVKQDFTVIQSQPMGAGYNLSDGVTEGDLVFFSKLDERFQYIADRGLVHANAQLFFVSELGWNRAKYSDAYLEKLCRYWVARYSAYPVMWTTAQESDNDYYFERGDHNYFDATTNPWKLVANYIHKYDPYKHPQTAHMEQTGFTLASGSSFKDLPGHSWFAAQWPPKKNGQLDFNIPKDFWNNGQGKPTVNYEGYYDHLWTNEFGARSQGWTAYLNGMYGHGYGAADIWLHNSTYDMDKPTINDGITITIADKQTKWKESLEFPSGYQMGYMHNFFKAIEWWNLTPRFDDPLWFSSNGSWYSVASKNNELIVAYFYNNINKNTGTLRNLANAQYTVQWFNPITGKYNTPVTITVLDSTYSIGNKPDIKDWVLLVKKK